jgi:two-component system, LytTR family, sensor kinase
VLRAGRSRWGIRPAHIPTTMPSRVRGRLGYFTLWTLLGLVFSTQLYLAEQRFSAHPSTWWQALRSELPDWYLWGLLALIVRWLARRFRIDRENWERAVPIHFGASLTLGFLHLGLSTAVQVALRGAAAYPFLPKLVDNFAASYHWNLLIYWAIVALVHARDYARDAQEHRVRAAQLEASVAEARLQALTLQLRPHFLFNTLNAIAELIHEDPNAAERMVGRLADLLRRTLETDGAAEVPLATELELVDRYLDIEAVRFQDRLQVRWEVAGDARAARVPAMILLPLVENAVRHGVSARPGPGVVGIRARRDADTLHLEVWDDGPGLDVAARGSVRRGIGLANTRARLAQLYGTTHRVELLDGAPMGLVVRVSLPYREARVA